MRFYTEAGFRRDVRPCLDFYYEGREIVFRGPSISPMFVEAWREILYDEMERFKQNGASDRLIPIPAESNTEYPNRLVFARPATL